MSTIDDMPSLRDGIANSVTIEYMYMYVGCVRLCACFATGK